MSRLLVLTARLSYGGPDRLDVTRLGAARAELAGKDAVGEPFAPSWGLLQQGKRRRLSFADYEKRFVAEMRRSYVTNRAAWDALLARPRVVLCCYCTTAEECHRAILRGRILPALGAVDGGEVEAAAQGRLRWRGGGR